MTKPFSSLRKRICNFPEWYKEWNRIQATSLTVSRGLIVKSISLLTYKASLFSSSINFGSSSLRNRSSCRNLCILGRPFLFGIRVGVESVGEDSGPFFTMMLEMFVGSKLVFFMTFFLARRTTSSMCNDDLFNRIL